MPAFVLYAVDTRDNNIYVYFFFLEFTFWWSVNLGVWCLQYIWPTKCSNPVRPWRLVAELQLGCPCVWVVCLCVVLNSLHSQHLTRPYSPRSQWHALAECWVQTSAQTWRSQTRGWKSRSESYCFISRGCCDSTRGLWTLNRYIRCHPAAAGTERGVGGASVQQKVLFRINCL